MSERLQAMLEEVSNKPKSKSYRDSFLYNQSGKNGDNMMKKRDQLLIDYIIKSERIDKRSQAFTGVREDVRRKQTSSILYTILMMDNVHLCIHTTELQPAFKVIDAVDLKSADHKPAIFIDVTKLVELKNGYYVCKNTAKLTSYLFAALIYLLYRKDINKITNNSALTISGAECYVSMFLYVLDYLRIIGYSANKDKIGYFVTLFYLNNMVGKELDGYTKNLACKVSGISPASVAAMDLYLEDHAFDNIDTFVSFLARTFKLKGLTTEVFIQKWVFLYGNGTQYGCELFTSFAIILAYAYSGSYIINQKQVEKCCGQSMVKFCNGIFTAGADAFDRSINMEENAHVIDPVTERLAESIRLSRLPKPESIKLEAADFGDVDSIEKKIQANIDHYTRIFDGQEKLATIFENAIKMALVSMDATCNEDTSFHYADGVLPVIINKAKPYLNESSKEEIKKALENRVGIYLEKMSLYRSEDIDKARTYSKYATECRNLL